MNLFDLILLNQLFLMLHKFKFTFTIYTNNIIFINLESNLFNLSLNSVVYIFLINLSE